MSATPVYLGYSSQPNDAGHQIQNCQEKNHIMNFFLNHFVQFRIHKTLWKGVKINVLRVLLTKNEKCKNQKAFSVNQQEQSNEKCCQSNIQCDSHPTNSHPNDFPIYAVNQSIHFEIVWIFSLLDKHWQKSQNLINT